MVKTVKDYLEYLHEEYPDIPKAVLLKVVEEGLGNMQKIIQSDLDVRIGNHTPLRQYKMSIIKPLSNWDELMKRAKNKYYQLQRRRAN